MFARPVACVLTDAHAHHLTRWGRAAILCDDESATLRDIMLSYAATGAEFALMHMEIKYYIQFGLSDADMDILRFSDESCGKSNRLKSADEKILAKKRNVVKAKVTRAFHKMEREFYPVLNPRFVVPVEHNGNSVSIRDIERDDVEDDLTISVARLAFDDPDVVESVVGVMPESVVGVMPEPVVGVMPEPVVEVMPEPVVGVIPEPVVGVIPEPVVEVMPSEEAIINVLFEARALFIGLVGVANDVSSVIESFLRRINARSILFVLPIVDPVRFDIFICIPSPALSHNILNAALNHPMRRPFFIYLPLSLLQTDIDFDGCRLNLIITSPTHAWFMGYLPGSSGSNQFRVRIIRA
jgi:hypothetical protein